MGKRGSWLNALEILKQGQQIGPQNGTGPFQLSFDRAFKLLSKART